jgi:alpha-ketoglutarate-dependent taurine dioxygenase
MQAIRALDPFGVEVAYQPTHEPGAAVASALRALLDEHGLLVIRSGPFSDAEHVALMRCFGRLEETSDGAPMRFCISNREVSDAPDGALSFHYDYAYDEEPTGASSLYGLDVAEGATPTHFASSHRVIERLPATLRRRLESLEALHACILDKSVSAAERPDPKPDPRRRGDPEWSPSDWTTRHPAVWRSPSGVPTLFLCHQHTHRLVGLPPEESERLLEAVYGHLYAPDNVYAHGWRLHDMVIWDNYTVQHARPEPTPQRRTLRRYQVAETDRSEEYLRVGRAHQTV